MSCVLSGFSEHGRKLVDCEFAAQDGSSFLSHFSFSFCCCCFCFPRSVAPAGIRRAGNSPGAAFAGGGDQRPRVSGEHTCPTLPSFQALIFPLFPEGCRSLWCGSPEPFPQGLIPQGWCGTQCHLGTHRWPSSGVLLSPATGKGLCTCRGDGYLWVLQARSSR